MEAGRWESGRELSPSTSKEIPLGSSQSAKRTIPACENPHDEATIVSMRDRASLFASQNCDVDHVVDDEDEEDPDEENDEDSMNNLHILTVANKLKTTGRPASCEFDAEIKALKHDAGRSIQKIERDVSIFGCILFHSLLFKK